MKGLPGGPKAKVAENTEAMDTTEPKTEVAEAVSEKAKKLQTILSGEVSIGLNLEFLFRNNHTDMVLLKNIKVHFFFFFLFFFSHKCFSDLSLLLFSCRSRVEWIRVTLSSTRQLCLPMR